MKICPVDGCERAVTKAGFCEPHYRRKLHHGHPTAGRTSRGMAAKIILDALQYESDECLIWPLSKTQGYAKARINGGSMLVTRHICELCHGAPPTPEHEAAHNCGKGHIGCINKRHLYWATHAENMDEKHVHGTIAKGSKIGVSKLTEDKVIDIIKSRERGVARRVLALRYGVRVGTITDICVGRSWSHLTGRGLQK